MQKSKIVLLSGKTQNSRTLMSIDITDINEDIWPKILENFTIKDIVGIGWTSRFFRKTSLKYIRSVVAAGDSEEFIKLDISEIEKRTPIHYECTSRLLLS